ncbi:hypothetical protein PR202_ga28168 [Eleusine coracana subsp. coracana]|uniref:Uncharacterized protein n=1 Tax=Eleusine coracana subsp. coracana TaxID=191504 RepID=A0AAV5DH03_ELECO|nr:hypothetical protein PR202_ga28168 [Eleusine coracana subsp. coracana]
MQPSINPFRTIVFTSAVYTKTSGRHTSFLILEIISRSLSVIPAPASARTMMANVTGMGRTPPSDISSNSLAASSTWPAAASAPRTRLHAWTPSWMSNSWRKRRSTWSARRGRRAAVWRRTRRVSCGWETGFPCARMRSGSWSAAAGRPAAESSEASAWNAGKQWRKPFWRPAQWKKGSASGGGGGGRALRTSATRVGGTRRSLERSATTGGPQRWWRRSASRRKRASGERRRAEAEVEAECGEAVEGDEAEEMSGSQSARRTVAAAAVDGPEEEWEEGLGCVVVSRRSA